MILNLKFFCQIKEIGCYWTNVTPILNIYLRDSLEKHYGELNDSIPIKNHLQKSNLRNNFDKLYTNDCE